MPILLLLSCFMIRFLLLREGLGHPDAYREALSGMDYATKGAVGGYGWNDPLNIYLAAYAYHLSGVMPIRHDALCNLLSVIIASLGVLAFYFFVKTFLNLRTAVFVAAALILSPFHIEHSVYFNHGNTELAFFLLTVFVLQCALKSYTTRKKTVSMCLCIVCGIVTGLFISSRSISGLLILPLLTYLFIVYGHQIKFKDLLIGVGIIGLFCSVTCLFIFPPQIVGVLLGRGERVLKGYQFLRNFQSAIALVFVQAISKPLLILYLVSLLYVAFRRRFGIIIISFCVVVPYCFFYAGLPGAPSRYFLCTLPFVLLPVCYAGDSILLHLRSDPPQSLDAQSTQHRTLSRLRIGDGINVGAIALLLLVVALSPWFDRAYHGHFNTLRYLTENDSYRIVSERIGRDVGENMMLVHTDKPMIQYYNYENPPEFQYIIESRDGEFLYVPLDIITKAIRRIDAGQPIYMSTYAMKMLRHTNLNFAFHMTKLWEMAGYTLFRINSIQQTRNGPQFHFDT